MVIDVGNIVIKGLRKTYGDFVLDIPELTLERGFVTGVIGDNGAGKTTLIRCLTGAAIVDSGDIDLGTDVVSGVIFDECPYPEDLRLKDLSSIFAHMFDGWDSDRFAGLCKDFGIDSKKKVKEYSRGMRMKVQAAVALSHPTGLLLLDEPTAGMDPAAREEFLDLIRGYMTDDDSTVVISSHITSDLEKIADYIVFIHNGKIILFDEKDSILARFGILHASNDSEIAGDKVICSRKTQYEHTYLIDDRDSFIAAHPDEKVDPASLEDIMIMITKGVEA